MLFFLLLAISAGADRCYTEKDIKDAVCNNWCIVEDELEGGYFVERTKECFCIHKKSYFDATKAPMRLTIPSKATLKVD